MNVINDSVVCEVDGWCGLNETIVNAQWRQMDIWG